MVKMTKRCGEDAKIAVRKHRRDALDMLETLVKDGEVSEDDGDRGEKKIEDSIADATKKIDHAVGDRESQIMGG